MGREEVPVRKAADQVWEMHCSGYQVFTHGYLQAGFGESCKLQISKKSGPIQMEMGTGRFTQIPRLSQITLQPGQARGM